jgi:site-specific recombinase XerD
MSTAQALITPNDLYSLLIPDESKANKDQRSRVRQFTAWLETQPAIDRYAPDLAAYRDHLLTREVSPLRPATVSVHLSTIRSAYARLLKDNALRDRLYTRAAGDLQRLGHADAPADRKAFVDEYLKRMENAIDPDASFIKRMVHQDTADGAHVRLTRAQAESILSAPGVVPLSALRDTAVIAMLLCTGIREAELCSLELPDLRQELGGELALHVRKGKGSKERLIPYGDLAWVLAVVDKYIEAAEITTGHVFRSVWKGGRRVRGPLSVRAVENIVTKYPVIGERGKLITVRPHDLRRTYARRLYEAGIDLLSISQNLGHAATGTTRLYIGELGADKRRAPGVYSFDLAQLNHVQRGNGHERSKRSRRRAA